MSNFKSVGKDDDLPLVSVAVVTYNQVNFLRECIESILMQDYPNIEIVVADDGSIDGTVDLLKEYESSGRGRFKLLLSPTNKGITNNQNLALSGCTGKYIAWIAGDDLMLPSKISKQVEFLDNNPDYSICYHDLEIFDSNSGRRLRLKSSIDKPMQGDIKVLIKYGAINGASSSMVRATSQPLDGFSKRIPVASDWLYWVECLMNGEKIGYIDEVLGKYRRHDNNVTSGSIRNPKPQEILDHLVSCEIIIIKKPEYYKEIKNLQARHLKSLRWLDSGNKYNTYLRASLSYKLNFKVLFALIANSLFNYKK